MTKLKTFSLFVFIIIASYCLQCPPGYDLIPPGQPLGICVIIGCTKPKKDQRCADNCVEGFAKTSTLTCQVIKCTSASKTSCTSCQPGYQLQYLQNSRILKVCVPTNCESFDKATRQCRKCRLGFDLNQKKVCSPINCDQANPQLSQCLKCKDQYALKPQRDINVCTPLNCSQYSIQVNQCVTCEAAFAVTPTGTCQIGEKNCVDFNEFSGLCYACKDGYRLMGFKSCAKESEACLRYEITGCTQCRIPHRVGKETCQANFCDEPNQNNSLKCNKCEPGYKLNEDSLCVVSNCQVFDKETWRCYNCLPIYGLASLPSVSNPIYTVQRCMNKFCKIFDQNNLYCVKCNDQYTLDNGTCVFTNCAKPGDTSCKQCIEGWRKNENGNCIVFDCQQYVNPTKCKSCTAGKRVYKGVCIQDNCLFRNEDGTCAQCPVQLVIHPQLSKYCVVYYCKKIDEESGDCVQCLPNFQLTENKTCQSTLCLKYQNKAGFLQPQCTNCTDGYQPEGICIAAKKYCESYLFQQGKCQKCAAGYQFNFNKTHCVPLRCRNSTLQSTYALCTRCNLGYSVTNFENKTQKCAPNNCTTLKENTCTECAKGFNLFIDICLADNCKQYDDVGFCAVCNFGFYLNKTTLLCQREKCLQETKEKCVKCQDNYYPDESETQMKGLCRPFGCQTIKFTDRSMKSEPPIKCMKCLAGFTPMPKTEMCAALDCAVLNMLTGLCQQCRGGFVLTADGRCTLVRNNQYCPDRKYPNQNFVCAPIRAKNCFSANPRSTIQCYKCEAGYFLQGKDCRSFAKCVEKYEYAGCLKCQVGFRINKDTGQCQNSVDNCLDYDKNSGECQQCDNGYQVILYPNKICKKIPQGCLKLDVWGICDQCQLPNRILNADKQCYYPAGNCLEYEYILGLCTKCEPGFYLNSDKNSSVCIQNPPNCQIGIGYGQCRKCINNFILNQGRCYKTIQKCQAYNLQKCTNCEIGYFVDSTQLKCRQIPRYCTKVVAKSDGACEECRDGFINTKGTCVRKIDLCVSYEETGLCLGCSDGYSLNQSRTICLLGNL